MPDGVLVEEIFLQVFLAGAELKARRRQKREMQPLLGADRAVARGHHGEIAGSFKPYLAAMAAAGKGLGGGHRQLLAVAIIKAFSGKFTTLNSPQKEEGGRIQANWSTRVPCPGGSGGGGVGSAAPASSAKASTVGSAVLGALACGGAIGAGGADGAILEMFTLRDP